MKTRKQGKDRRTKRWAALSVEEKRRRKESQLRYARTPQGKAHYMAWRYKRWDFLRGMRGDVTGEWILEVIFSAACHYCGTIEPPIGCDRIDNSIGHLRSNIVPCCWVCNAIRGDAFSVEEMKEIGGVLRTIRARRKARGEAPPFLFRTVEKKSRAFIG